MKRASPVVDVRTRSRKAVVARARPVVARKLSSSLGRVPDAPAELIPVPGAGMRRPSLRDVARVAGCHYSTVSLALRNNPTIPALTRESIRRVAEDLGYRPDAMLAALSAYRVAKRTPHHRPVLAWCSDYPPRETGCDSSSRCHHHAGAFQRAEERGYVLEHFWLAEPGMTGTRMSAILRHRGIRGVVMAPRQQPGAAELEWAEFSAVAIGCTSPAPKLHLVDHHDYRMMSSLITELRGRGYRRIGLVELRAHDARVEHNWLAAYLAAQHGGMTDPRLPPLLLASWQENRVLDWTARYRPDVIVTKLQPLKRCLEQAGYRVPDDVGLAFHSSVDLPGSEALSGMRTDARVVGSMAIDFLVGLLHRNETGVPMLPQRLLIEATWVEGATLRPHLGEFAAARMVTATAA